MSLCVSATVGGDDFPWTLEFPRCRDDKYAVMRESVRLVIVRLFRRLGQFIASSPTLFPPEYVAEFQQTLDRAPPVPYPAIEAILIQELGHDLNQTFSYINPVPLATASVVRSQTGCCMTLTARSGTADV